MNRELLEVRNVHLTPLRRIQVRVLAPGAGSLDDWVRNLKAICERSIAPPLVVDEQPTEDINVRFLDHPEEDCIKYRYMIRKPDKPSA